MDAAEVKPGAKEALAPRLSNPLTAPPARRPAAQLPFAATFQESACADSRVGLAPNARRLHFATMSSTVSIIISLLCSLTCCLLFVVIILAAIGFMVSRKSGKKKKLSAKQAVKLGADVSRAFIRGDKTREELLREAELDDDD